MTPAAGTFCYIDPEYQRTGMFTARSDTYSLGAMLLQSITAKSPVGLAHHVFGHATEKGTFGEMLDPAVPDWHVEEALAFAKLSQKFAEMTKDGTDLGTVIVPEINRPRVLGMRPALSHITTISSGHIHGQMPLASASTSSLPSYTR